MKIQLTKCFLFVFFFMQAQKTDSLKHQLAIIKTDTGRVNLYTTLASNLLHENVKESFSYAFKGASLSAKIKYDKGLAESYQILGNLHGFNSNDSALFYLTKSKDLKYKLKDLRGVASLYTSIGTYYDLYGNSELALTNYIKSLKLFDSLSIPKGIAGSALGIGNVFATIKNYKKAIEYYHLSIINYKKINSPYLSWAINNLATVYEKTNDRQKAKSLYEESLKLKIANNDFYGAVFSIDNIGLILHKEGKNQEALNYFFKALKINRGNQLEKETFANSYKNISESLLSINKNSEASLYLDSLWGIINKLNLSNLKLEYVKLKSVYFENIKDYKNALFYKDKYIILSDSFFNYDINKKVSEADAKYKTEKKQKEIELLNKDNIIQQIKIDKQQEQKKWFIVGLVCLIVLMAYLYKSYLQKQKANTLITSQKKEVENKNLIIEEKQTEILDSIHYAKRIQNALLASETILNKNLNNHENYFILYNPKDIVSGDFYWATEFNNKFYLAVCDCTGHGVPGAFMSLLNIGFLSEAIKEKNIEQPNEVLNYVRKRIIESIGNEGQQDGMDAILLCIDKLKSTITYSAANNEPILISGKEIIELPKDKMPVGKGEKTDSFSLHKVDFKKGDVLYLYTDGFADQFGGPKGKKFKYKPLNNLLFLNSANSMINQKEILIDTLNSWKGNLEQVDDVCIVGIKL